VRAEDIYSRAGINVGIILTVGSKLQFLFVSLSGIEENVQLSFIGISSISVHATDQRKKSHYIIGINAHAIQLDFNH